MKTLALAALLAAAPVRDGWFGPDKVKHFLMSAFVHSATFSAGRAVGIDRSAAQVGAGVLTMGVGIWKESRDRRSGGAFSSRDLAWDAAGALSAAALLNGTR